MAEGCRINAVADLIASLLALSAAQQQAVGTKKLIAMSQHQIMGVEKGLAVVATIAGERRPRSLQGQKQKELQHPRS